MITEPSIADVAAVAADATRARMLVALMDGRALTATELALVGAVAPSTASSHLARLTAAGFITVVRQGRHRYFRLSGPQIATLVEGMLALASGGPAVHVRTGPSDPRLRRARVCYDHLAGSAGVRLLERLEAADLIAGSAGSFTVTPAGERWTRRLDIDVAELRAGRRPLCLSCLDWSERRPHLAGALGAALLDQLLRRRVVVRERAGRALRLTDRAESFIEHPELGL
jgi:DNA-binding transcriptional ArsR family regulator